MKGLRVGSICLLGLWGTSTRITGFKVGGLDLVEFRGQKWMVFARRGRKAGTRRIWKETKGGEVRGPQLFLFRSSILVLLRKVVGDWRDGSRVRSTNCSSR